VTRRLGTPNDLGTAFRVPLSFVGGGTNSAGVFAVVLFCGPANEGMSNPLPFFASYHR
jgi:hypothetical protein